MEYDLSKFTPVSGAIMVKQVDYSTMVFKIVDISTSAQLPLADGPVLKPGMIIVVKEVASYGLDVSFVTVDSVLAYLDPR